MVLLATGIVFGLALHAIDPPIRTLRIGTLNIHASNDAQPDDINALGGFSWGGPDYRRLLVLDQIQSASLDIFALQEVKPDQLRFLTKNFASTHHAIEGCLTRKSDDGLGFSNITQPIFVAMQRFAVKESGCFMLSKTPLILDSQSWGSGPRFVSWVRVSDRLDGSVTYILNVHLAASKDQEYARQESAKVITDFIRDKTKWSDEIILAGDLNSKPNSVVHNIIRDEGKLKETSVRAQVSLGPFRTYNSLGDASPNYKIDFIYTRHLEASQYEVHEANTDGRFPSDHNLVVAEFRYS